LSCLYVVEPWATPAPVPWFQDLKSRTGGIPCELRRREYSSSLLA
jgi:hypothetical protein